MKHLFFIPQMTLKHPVDLKMGAVYGCPVMAPEMTAQFFQAQAITSAWPMTILGGIDIL